jgi:hypothetical protein
MTAEVDHLVGLDPHVVEAGRPGAGEALAEAVPVVEDRDALTVHRDRDRGDRVLRGRGVDLHVVGVEAAGRVELLAVQAEAVAGGVRGQDRLEAHPDRPAALLADRVAEDLALVDDGDPAGAALGVGLVQQALDEGEVDAQDVGDVGVRLGERHQHLEELAQRRPAAALGDGHADRPEPGVLDQPDLGERGDSVALPLRRARRDLAEQAREGRRSR